MIIHGYKAFNEDCSTRYGEVLNPKHFYIVDENIQFGKKGYHFCQRLEDTLRYVDGFQKIKFAKVSGMGDILEYWDDYYGYYDMYCCSTLYIDHFLTDEEVWDYIINLFEDTSLMNYRLLRVIQGYKLNDKQKSYILNYMKNKNYYDQYEKAIEYYQEGNKYVYQKRQNNT